MQRRFAGLVIVALASATSGAAQERSGAAVFNAFLSGENEVPKNVSTGTGGATFRVVGSQVRYTVKLGSISNVTAVDLRDGEATVNGPVLVQIYRGPTKAKVEGTLVSGSFTEKDLKSGKKFSELLQSMRDGKAYVNVFTTQYPSGEIRGQIQPAKKPGMAG